MVCLIKKTNKREQFLIGNRRGWIRIVEAFVAILLIAGIVLIVIERDQAEREDVSSGAYTSMVAILREIQLNNTLRNEIVSVQNSSLPVEWEEFDVQAPKTKAKITEKTPGYLECVGKICATNDICLLTQDQENQGKTIYAESVIISSTLQTYNPRILKLFCWTK